MEAVTAPRAAASPLVAYVNVAKPKAIFPHLITAAAAMFVAAGGTPAAVTLLLTMVGGGFLAAAANTFNSILDRDIDAGMLRTRNRPLPSGRITSNKALVYGAVLGLVGVAVLARVGSLTAVVLALIALGYYVVPYTLWLKRRTYWSAVVGSAIGAVPPLIGWVVVTHRIQPAPFLLGAIIVFWTLPHFWALAVFRRGDYESVGLRMLPAKGLVTWMIACALLLVAASLLLVPFAHLGWSYAGTASLCGAGFVYLTLRMVRKRHPRSSWYLYNYSIVYIAVLFGAMIIDRILLSA
jgi:protoheme IX farnesyltransferase